MIARDTILEVTSPVAALMPEYHPDGADINESLDLGIASCAVRAYAAGLLLRHHFPSEELYVLSYGFAPDHGGEFHGANGTYVKMGHAVTRLWVPEHEPLIVESYNDSRIEVVAPAEEHEDFIWMGVNEGYRAYLDRADFDDVEFDAEEILGFLLKGSQNQAAA